MDILCDHIPHIHSPQLPSTKPSFAWSVLLGLALEWVLSRAQKKDTPKDDARKGPYRHKWLFTETLQTQGYNPEGTTNNPERVPILCKNHLGDLGPCKG